MLILFCILFSEVGKSDIVSTDCIAYSTRTVLCSYASHNQTESATRVSDGQIWRSNESNINHYALPKVTKYIPQQCWAQSS